MFVVFRWWCPYTTGPSPATRICACDGAGAASAMAATASAKRIDFISCPLYLLARGAEARKSTLVFMMKLLVVFAVLLAQAAADPPLVDNDRVNVRERPTIGGPAGSIVRQTP